MNVPFYWIDTFTDRLFRGNPAGVVPLERWLEDELMQQIAAENGFSETAFFVPAGSGRYALRWFMPTSEAKLCGHATLASAYALFFLLGARGTTLSFETLSGELRVKRLPDDSLELDFPADPPSVPESEPESLARALGITPERILRNGANWFCVYSRQEEIQSLKPDFRALEAVIPGRVIVTAPGREPFDFVSRFFAPGVGIDEDPVTGSAHCGLIPYWAKRLGKASLRAAQLSERGGTLRCEDRGTRVAFAGRAVVYLAGELRL